MARTTVFVLSDHGFKAVKRQIRPNAAFRNAGLLTVQDGKVTKAEAYSVPEGGTAMVYVTVPDPSGAGPETRAAGTRRVGGNRPRNRAGRVRESGAAAARGRRADGGALPHGEGGLRVHRRSERPANRGCTRGKPWRSRVHRDGSGPARSLHRVGAWNQARHDARCGRQRRRGADGRAPARVGFEERRRPGAHRNPERCSIVTRARGGSRTG